MVIMNRSIFCAWLCDGILGASGENPAAPACNKRRPAAAAVEPAAVAAPAAVEPAAAAAAVVTAAAAAAAVVTAAAAAGGAAGGTTGATGTWTTGNPPLVNGESTQTASLGRKAWFRVKRVGRARPTQMKTCLENIEA